MRELEIVHRDERLELFDGQVALRPASADAAVVRRVRQTLVEFYAHRDTVVERPQLRLSNDWLLEPDLVVVRGSNSPACSPIAFANEVVLVVEIRTADNLFSYRERSTAYAGFGAQAYWLIDTVREQLEAYTAPLAERYERFVALTRDDDVSVPERGARLAAARILSG